MIWLQFSSNHYCLLKERQMKFFTPNLCFPNGFFWLLWQRGQPECEISPSWLNFLTSGLLCNIFASLEGILIRCPNQLAGSSRHWWVVFSSLEVCLITGLQGLQPSWRWPISAVLTVVFFILTQYFRSKSCLRTPDKEVDQSGKTQSAIG